MHEPDNNQRSLEGSSKSPNSFQFFSTVRKQLKCVDQICEEVTTKCNNNVCDTTKSEFKSDKYRPVEILKIEKPEIDISDILHLPQNFPFIDIDTFDNSALIDLLANVKNFTYSWNNSKRVDKKCQNNICTITTKTCKNEKCTENTISEKY